ncbi:FAD-dependent oxidoreductase [Clostridium beijerinckii]|jgi:2-enoate reductase|uniref:FAD-dependent oxidoreductase n=2 Tax=Clostridium beijerinckii TaxID=1520 RepID=A0AAE2V288_CLOBE|nr:FAD-dependent oxidoreductase [Clostridium beijerinckii]ABR34097.1 NADH:flavin oxidoreductase/NADH oxidase [Clostridium beijerinckii NCIMB 8052]AIU02858.1 NADH:flavin oxidoreductase/NADH oxidase [Clostridium beijerinckii ATCC 35702]MBF7811298.1 FAD-dependent oxidoreductase [Clostridium beijerinckii]NRT24607.1 2-enoate reductase [Clostridium beijerinckii]NRT67801.1 2-enoate reductase [Clostridium beijerinckii]
MNKYKKLFEPIKIGKCEIKNRFALAPMGPLGLADSEGGFNQRGIDYYTERAKGGTGLIITGVTFVDNEVEEHGMPSTPCPTHNPVHFVRTSKEMTERIHAYNAKVFLQMSGGFGRVTIPTNLGEYPPVAPSAIQHRWLDKICRELTIDEIKSIVKKFGDGAYNAKRAGFDGVQIHAVHEGYLIDQFAISLFNHRTDEYGGSLENRLRFAREIVEEIKDRCGEDFPVTLRYSPKSFIKDLRDGALPGEEFIEKGRDLEEGIEAAKLLVSYGYDSLDIDVGSYDSWWWSHPPMYQEKGLYRPYAKLMKETVDVPVICAGRMDNPDMAIEAIENGTCDIVSLGRPLLADPDYVNKLRANKCNSIRPCISCQEGCMGRLQNYAMLNCAVNPQACKEKDNALTPILGKKKVLIVGGGVAGCEVARVLALRGHEPVLYEKTDRLGGNLIPGGSPDFKEDDIALANWYANTLKELNVEVNLNSEITKEQILSYKADSVIIATGSTPKVFSLGDDEKVFTAADVLLGKKESGNNTVVVGGGLVGCELALDLAKKGKKVTIVEALHKILALNGPLCSANSEMLERLIPFNGIEVKVNSKVKAYKDGNLEIETENGVEKIKCDSVILSVGYKEENSLYRELEFEIPEIYLLGDARKVSNIMYAIWDAYEVANHI